ncbi:hypothetical protein [Actinomadura sp. 6N118]|uniref:hypothetical protein n=1 Tax=Actinomadura sp. 6N118 TaxID=3375151 RepID=UPI00379CBF94
MRRVLTTFTVGAAAAASIAYASPAQAVPTTPTTNATTAAVSADDTASAAGWSRWKAWTLQPGVGGVEVKGKTRSRKVNGRVQVDIRAQVRDTDLNNSKNACAKGIAYLIPVGSRTGNVCGGRNWKHFQAGGWGVKQVRMRECVDNTWSLEKCSSYKTIYPI